MNRSVTRFRRITGAAAGVAATTQLAAWLASRRAGRVNVVDVAWGPGIAGIAATSALLGHGRPARRWLLAGSVGAWATRLAVHVHHAGAGRGEDPRYQRMLDGAGTAKKVVKVFVLQGALQWLISLPLQANAAARDNSTRTSAIDTIAATLGAALIAAGGITEAAADRQKANWKKDPQHGPVMDRGLWSYSRHPNYLGDAALWWGVYLAAAPRKAWWTVVSPAAITWLLVFGSGAKPAEKLRDGDADYAAYQRRVSFFLPRPPKSL